MEHLHPSGGEDPQRVGGEKGELGVGHREVEARGRALVVHRVGGADARVSEGVDHPCRKGAEAGGLGARVVRRREGEGRGQDGGGEGEVFCGEGGERGRCQGN